MALEQLQYSPIPNAGTIDLQVVDNNGSPGKVIDANLAFKVVGNVSVTAGGLLDGQFRLQLLGDQRGGAFDGQVGADATVNITGDGVYPINITIPANTLPIPAQPGRPRQIVALCMLVTYERADGATTDLTGIVDFGTFLFS